MKLAFLICTEPGRLEGQSLLLAESIRRFAGSLRDTPIYSFHPRQGDPIGNRTLKMFEELGVIHQQILLNIDYHDYYLANKILVCAYAEQNIDAEILVFLDSDKCIFSEPKEFLLPVGYNVGLRPEYGKGIGSEGEGDIQDEYWQKLYKLLGVQKEVFVETAIGKKRIRGYWNSGLIAVRKEARFFTSWKKNFEKVMQKNLEPLQGNYFLEMSVLAATACSRSENIFEFSPSYSYPLPLHNRLSKEYKLNSFEKMVSIHYFNMFFYKDWMNQLKNLRNIDQSSEQYKWLCEGVIRHSMPYHSVLHRYMLVIRRVEKKLLRFNIKINFSGLLERVAKL